MGVPPTSLRRPECLPPASPSYAASERLRAILAGVSKPQITSLSLLIFSLLAAFAYWGRAGPSLHDHDVAG